MGGVLAKMISKKILGESLENKFGYEDPYFENIPASKLGDTSSRKKNKKRRKALPPGISDHDREVLTKVKRRAYRLDMCLFSCCGIRFGWSSVIGFMPGFGDALDAFMALMVFRTCQQVEGGLPKSVSLKMMTNIIIDFCIGLVPVMGDICDAMFRANTRNAVVLENFLRDKGAKNLMGHSDNPAPDPSDPERYDRREREDFPASSQTAKTRAKAVKQSN